MLVLESNNMLFIVVGVVFDTMHMCALKTARSGGRTRNMPSRRECFFDLCKDDD